MLSRVTPIIIFYITVAKIPGVKSKVKNQSVERLLVQVMRGSQKVLTKKNFI